MHMDAKPRINPAAIDLLTRVFNSHKKGLPEWLKNSREAYLRKNVDKSGRHVIINYQSQLDRPYLECIDFAGISGDEIEDRYLEWANPEAAAAGLKVGQAEGGQGNGGKAYLREMFDKGFFVSISTQKLSVVSFIDQKRHILDFVPDRDHGKGVDGDSAALPGIRRYATRWLERYGIPAAHNITIVRGVSPRKPVDPDHLLEIIQQVPQARETIRTCQVHFCVNGSFRKELKVIEPTLHRAFQEPTRIAIPPTLIAHGSKVQTARPPDYPEGELVLCVSEKPLQGQALATWNRIDFHGKGISVIGHKPIEELPLEFPQYGRYLYGVCTVPLLTDPKETYELQGRVRLNDGPLSDALYAFIAEEANKVLTRLAKQMTSLVQMEKRKNLERLNDRLASWVESKLSILRGLRDTGDEEGSGKLGRKPREEKEHSTPVTLKIHREALNICKGVSYPLRAVAYDAARKPTLPGKLVWRSQDPAIVSVHPDRGVTEAKSVGMTTVTVSNNLGQTSPPVFIQVHEAESLEIRTAAPAKVGSNRRLPLVVAVRTLTGKTLKDVIVSWKSSDPNIVTIGPDGILVGGEVGEAEVIAHVGPLESEVLDVIVEKGAAGKPKGGGKGKPHILLSGQDPCPFDKNPVHLAPTDPAVYQRPYKPDYDNNVFWINLQHPLADALLRQGEESVQWRTYHFQRIVDVFTILESRTKFADSENLDVDQVLDELHLIATELYAKAKDELFEVLYDEDIDLSNLLT
jgi:hypothetical protein